MQQTAGCGCEGGRRRKSKTRKGGRRTRRSHARKSVKRGGGIVEDAVIGLGALGLYSYFAKKK